jgi:hypothetical protein
VALIDIEKAYLTNEQFNAIRDLYQNAIISREEFLNYLPAGYDPALIDFKGYFIPAIPAPPEIPESIDSRFEILDL